MNTELLTAATEAYTGMWAAVDTQDRKSPMSDEEYERVLDVLAEVEGSFAFVGLRQYEGDAELDAAAELNGSAIEKVALLAGGLCNALAIAGEREASAEVAIIVGKAISQIDEEAAWRKELLAALEALGPGVISVQ